MLLRPGDLWIDWWIPADDHRSTRDARAAAARAGGGGATPWRPRRGRGDAWHEGPPAPARARVACFAGRGPGEVFVAGRKAVGLTQWRVREGALLSTRAAGSPSPTLVDLLASPPAGLRAALDHHTLGQLGLDDPAALLDDLAAHGPLDRASTLALG